MFTVENIAIRFTILESAAKQLIRHSLVKRVLSSSCYSPLGLHKYSTLQGKNTIQWFFSLSGNQIHTVVIQIYTVTDGFISLALLLLIITSNIVVKESQGNWYCSIPVNRSCANTSSYVDCHSQNYSCTAYSCNSQSAGCSCKIGSYNCSNDCNYVSPDVCNCEKEPQSCYCLGGVYSTVLCVSYTVFIQIHPISFLPDKTTKNLNEVCKNEPLKDGL